jgi:aminopeptidase N
VFHSWFGRGVKPECASDGWIDEAMASWATASRRAATGRFQAEPLGLDEEPSLLYLPHPWSRHTPRKAYGAGSRLFSGLAHMAGGAAQLRSALAAWYDAHGGGAASTEDLARHLEAWCGRDLSPWWDRYVYGAEVVAP